MTLTGPGGTGKTRLALQAAAEVSDSFPDGVWWVPLAAIRDASLVHARIAEAVGVQEESGRALAATLVERLTGKQALLLLDNAEHLLPDIAAEIVPLLASGSLRFLVTSRERLQLTAEQVYPVPTLEERTGVELFVTRARSLGGELVAGPALLELCARLDNLPLALELAAARTVVFGPEQLLERLSRRLDLFKGGRDADPRQQTLRATIDWSYELLGEEEQRVLARSERLRGRLRLRGRGGHRGRRPRHPAIAARQEPRAPPRHRPREPLLDARDHSRVRGRTRGRGGRRLGTAAPRGVLRLARRDS